MLVWNSPKDDFGYWIDTKSRRGFSLQIEMADKVMMTFINSWKLLLCEQNYLESDRTITSEILPGAKISLFDNKFNPMGTVNTDDKGIYTFTVECGKTYNVRAEKEDYTTKGESVLPTKGKTNFGIALEKVQCKVTVGR
jgi:hypothetical protein